MYLSLRVPGVSPDLLASIAAFKQFANQNLECAIPLYDRLVTGSLQRIYRVIQLSNFAISDKVFDKFGI